MLILYGLQLMAPENLIFSIDSNDNDSNNVFAIIHNDSSLYGGDSDLPGESYTLFTVEESGNVGIGITNPTALLTFPTDTVAAGGIAFGSDVNLYRVTNNYLRTDDTFQAAGAIDAITSTYSPIYYDRADTVSRIYSHTGCSLAKRLHLSCIFIRK